MRLPAEHHYYVASPYKNFEGGHDNAAHAVAVVTARLLDTGFDVFSPIVHGHALAATGLLSAHNGDHDFWLKVDKRYMNRADAILVVMLPGWRESFGVQWEIEEFRKAGKPILYIDPLTFQVHEG